MSNIKIGNKTYNNIDSVKLRNADNEAEFVTFGAGGGGEYVPMRPEGTTNALVGFDSTNNLQYFNIGDGLSVEGNTLKANGEFGIRKATIETQDFIINGSVISISEDCKNRLTALLDGINIDNYISITAVNNAFGRYLFYNGSYQSSGDGILEFIALSSAKEGTISTFRVNLNSKEITTNNPSPAQLTQASITFKLLYSL